MNIHLGYKVYSHIIEKCIEKGELSLTDMYASTIASSFFYPRNNKKTRAKIYKAVCNYLEHIAAKNYDDFISYYYNSSYYSEDAKENISDFLDAVRCIYKGIDIISDSTQNSEIRFPHGKKFKLCYKSFGKSRVEIAIDTNNLSCFWGSIDCFYIHFKNGLSIFFDHGALTIYTDYDYVENT